MDNRNKVQQIIDAHSAKAQQSAYDRGTCVLAVLTARETVMTIPDEVDEQAYPQQVIQKLDELFNNYHDPDGEYTSGRAVIGSLRDDIRYAFYE